MQLTPGVRLGPYEVLAPIGAGGMGEVYRGRDTRLDRDVAIKIVPLAAEGPAEVRDRFRREATAISRLSHPHICTLFDVGQQDGNDYLVMEYLDGETLADRIGKGPLPFANVLRYGAEIAEALGAAHRAGIVHRDLKPGNIMLTRSGVKVLDFGLAKPIAEAVDANAVTEQKPLTERGMIIGTIRYMAPEQLEGREADARSDIFALGVILWEMATGRHPFASTRQIDLMRSILHDEPAAARLPPAFDRVVRKCLAKDPEERWQSARDIASELRWIAEARPQAKRIPRMATMVIAGSIAAAGAIGGFFLWRPARSAAPPAVRFTIPIPKHSALSPFSGPVVISPDGKSVAFFTMTEGRYILWIRPLASLEAKPLAGTEGGSFPFWSPDGRHIGFVAGNKIKVIDLDGGGLPRTVCDVPELTTATWNRDGSIVFGSAASALFRVSASGGTPVPLTSLDRSRGELRQLWPSFLPDGRHFVYLSQTTDPNRSAIYLGAMGSHQTTQLVLANSNAVVADGDLLYSVDRKLVAAPLDVATKKVGPAHTVAERVWGFPVTGGALFSASNTGVLVYATPEAVMTKLAWVNRAGQEQRTIAPPPEAVQVSLAPSGQQALVESVDPSIGSGTIWLYDVARGVISRLTLERSWTGFPTWFRDGAHMAYNSTDGTQLSIDELSTGGGGTPRVLITSKDVAFPNDVGESNDLLFVRVDPTRRSDLWVEPASGGPPHPFIVTSFDEFQGQFSPDGRWVAYTSNESGRLEVYVRDFPAASRTIAISTHGGSEPRWSKDGHELFYLSPDDELMSVPVKPGSQLDPGTPQTLFKFSPVRYFGRFDYDVDPTGQRFLINTRVSSSGPDIVVATDWR